MVSNQRASWCSGCIAAPCMGSVAPRGDSVACVPACALRQIQLAELFGARASGEGERCADIPIVLLVRGETHAFGS